MVLLGGLGSYLGPVTSALLLFLLQELFGGYGAWYLAGVGFVANLFALHTPPSLSTRLERTERKNPLFDPDNPLVVKSAFGGGITLILQTVTATSAPWMLARSLRGPPMNVPWTLQDGSTVAADLSDRTNMMEAAVAGCHVNSLRLK